MLDRTRARNRHDCLSFRPHPRQHHGVRRCVVLCGDLLHDFELRNLLRQFSAADGTVGEKGDVVFAAVVRDVDRFAKVGIETVLHRLHVDDPLRPLDLRDRDIRQSDVLALSFALQRRECLDAFLQSDRRIDGVKLVEPNLFDCERSQTLLARFAYVLGRSIARPRTARATQSRFRADVNIIAIANDRGDEALVVADVVVVEAVDVGGVDEVHAGVDHRLNDAPSLLFRRTPLNGERHSAEADFPDRKHGHTLVHQRLRSRSSACGASTPSERRLPSHKCVAACHPETSHGSRRS